MKNKSRNPFGGALRRSAARAPAGVGGNPRANLISVRPERAPGSLQAACPAQFAEQ